MGMRTEKWFPIVVGTVAAMLYFLMFRGYAITDSVQNLLLAIVSIAAIAVGFLATAKSILISIDDKLIVQRLKRVGYYKILVDYLLGAVWWSFGLSILSTACILVDWKDPGGAWWNRLLLAAWIFVLTTAMLACGRVIYIFGKLLRTEDPPTGGGSIS
jgi:hypothetical protein